MGGACCGQSSVAIFDEKGKLNMGGEMRLKELGIKYGLEEHQKQRLVQTFNSVDADNGGTIEYKEFLTALDVQDGPLAQSFWAICDDDNSGELDFFEFIEAVGKTFQVRTEQAKLDWTFDLYDINHDGRLSQSEFRKCVFDPNVVEIFTAEQREAVEELFLGWTQGSRELFVQLGLVCAFVVHPGLFLLNKLKSAAFTKQAKLKPPDVDKGIQEAKKLWRSLKVKNFKKQAVSPKSSPTSSPKSSPKSQAKAHQKAPKRSHQFVAVPFQLPLTEYHVWNSLYHSQK